MGTPESPHRSFTARLRAWSVHLLTASGAVIGTFSLFEIAEGRMGSAILLMLIALFIDAVDGTLARAARVSVVVPEIDGRRLDDMVDFLNFVIVPTFFFWSASSFVHDFWLAAPVLASAYGFSRVDAKTKDDFFLGFPSYWNILAIYFWLLDLSPVYGTIWVALLSLSVFLPLKFLYPSKVEPMSLRVLLGVGAILWTGALVVCVVWPEWAERMRLLPLSLLYPAWYFYLSFRRGGVHRRDRESPARGAASGILEAPERQDG